MITEALKQNQCILAWNGQVATANAPKAITPAGNVTQLLPFSGAGIGMFDGSGDYLTITYNSDLDPGANDFYFECYAYFTSQAERFIFEAGGSSSYPIWFSMDTSTYKVYFGFKNASLTNYSTFSASAITAGTWHHIVCQKTGSSIAVALDGIWGTPTACSGSVYVLGQNWYIGTHYNATRYMYGNLSEFKYKIGSSPYIIGTNFTPQYKQLESDSNTKLLLHFNRNDTTFIDSSPSAHTIASAGNAKQLCSPCGSGVAYFDGSGDQIAFISSDFNFGTGDFTIEGWFYQNDSRNNVGMFCVGAYSSGGPSDCISLWQYTSYYVIDCTGGGNTRYAYGSESTLTISLNSWQHFAYVRSGNNLNLYRNGTLAKSIDVTGKSFNLSGDSSTIGNGIYGHSYYTNENVSEFRISNIARYTANYTPSTALFKPDPYTKLLLHMDGTGNAFYDSSDPPSDNGFPILPDGVTVTPTGTFAVQKMKDGRNIWKFDGSTNYITISDHASWSMFLSNFTISLWVRFDSVAANKVIMGQYADANNQWYLQWTTGNIIQLYGIVSSTATFDYSCPLTAVANTWYHVVVQRSGTSCIMYINVIPQTITATTAWTAVATNIAAVLSIGNVSTGYQAGNIKDLRVFAKALTVDQIAALYQETFIY